MPVRLSELKPGDVIVGSVGDCVPYGEHIVHQRGTGRWSWFIDCLEGSHSLASETSYDDGDLLRNFKLKDRQPMNDLIVTSPVGSAITEENVSMLRESLSNFGQAFASMLVDASKLKAEFEALKEEVKKLREETQQANRLREMSDKAYQAVNTQRIEAENQLHAVRGDLVNAERERETANLKVNELTVDLEAAKGKITALEEDQLKLIKESEETIASAKATAEAKVADIEFKYVQKNGEMSRLIERLAEVEAENRRLTRKVQGAKNLLNEEEMKGNPVLGG